MEPGSEKKKDHREITYHVGWKKGKIEWNEGITSQIPANSEIREQTAIANGQKRLKLLWRTAPGLPGIILLPLLYALPIVCFILTVILVYSLRHGA